MTGSRRFLVGFAMVIALVGSAGGVARGAAPTDITLSSSSVPESRLDWGYVGSFSTADADLQDFHTYSLVPGAGDGDNGLFSLYFSELTITLGEGYYYLDYEYRSNYSIRVRTDDGTGGTFEKVFRIDVVNVTQDDHYITVRNTPLAVGAPGVLANDHDPDGQSFGVESYFALSPGATVTGSEDGSFTYTPPPGYTGGDVFEYYGCKTGDGYYDCARSIAWVTVANLYETFEDGVANGFVTDGTGAWSVNAISPATSAHGGRLYRVKARGPFRVYMSRTAGRYANFTYSADVRLAGGGPDSPTRGNGIVFRSGRDYRNGYVFHVNARGFYNIFKRVNGVTKPVGGLSVGWRPSKSIRRGVGAWNRLEVECNGASITFKINGATVKTLRDTSFASGHVGLKAFGDGANADRVEFDNVLLVSPPLRFPSDRRGLVGLDAPTASPSR